MRTKILTHAPKTVLGYRKDGSPIFPIAGASEGPPEPLGRHRLLAARGEQMDRIALAFHARPIGSGEKEVAGLNTKLLADLAAGGGERLLPRADAAAGQYPGIRIAIAVADQQQRASVIEHHHLDSARPRPEPPPQPALQAIGEVEDRSGRHRPASSHSAGRWTMAFRTADRDVGYRAADAGR